MKAMTISKEPICSKLELDGKMVEQEMGFNYLGVNNTSSGNLVKEIKVQAQKAARVVGCLNDLVRKRKYTRKKQNKIYKATVRPMMTYALEVRAET